LAALPPSLAEKLGAKDQLRVILRVCDFFQFEETANAANRATTDGGCHPEKPKATKDLHFLDFRDARRTADPSLSLRMTGWAVGSASQWQVELEKSQALSEAKDLRSCS